MFLVERMCECLVGSCSLDEARADPLPGRQEEKSIIQVNITKCPTKWLGLCLCRYPEPDINSQDYQDAWRMTIVKLGYKLCFEQSHSDELFHWYNFCGKYFTTKSMLSDHILYVHIVINELFTSWIWMFCICLHKISIVQMY